MRRVVTGIGRAGRSCVVSDSLQRSSLLDMAEGDDLLVGTSTALNHPCHPGARQATAGIVWSSDGDAPLALDGFPQSEATWRVAWHRTVFGPNTAARKHATPTFDVDVVISGEVDLLLEDGQVRLGPGDTVVIPGVVHGWRTGSTSCDFICAIWTPSEMPIDLARSIHEND